VPQSPPGGCGHQPLWSRRAAPGKAQSSSGSKLVLPEPFAPATNAIVGRFNGTTGLTKERFFVAAGENLFQPLSFEGQPSPGRLGHLLSDLEPLSMIYNPVIDNDTPIRIVGKHAGGPPFQKRPGWTIPSRTWQKGTSTPCCRVSWNLTVNVRCSRGRRNIVGPAF
jgi:hypothetical protein